MVAVESRGERGPPRMRGSLDWSRWWCPTAAGAGNRVRPPSWGTRRGRRGGDRVAAAAAGNKVRLPALERGRGRQRGDRVAEAVGVSSRPPVEEKPLGSRCVVGHGRRRGGRVTAAVGMQRWADRGASRSAAGKRLRILILPAANVVLLFIRVEPRAFFFRKKNHGVRLSNLFYFQGSCP